METGKGALLSLRASGPSEQSPVTSPRASSSMDRVLTPAGPTGAHHRPHPSPLAHSSSTTQANGGCLLSAVWGRLPTASIGQCACQAVQAWQNAMLRGQ